MELRGSLTRAPDLMHYRAIWISDLHLGSPHAQTELLLEFLRTHECRQLYLVGDIIDGWELRRRWHWTEESNTVIQKILRKNRKDTRVTYLHGNHDEFLQEFIGLDAGGVRIGSSAVHVTASRRRYLVIHGHQLDGLVHFNRLLERVGSSARRLSAQRNLWNCRMAESFLALELAERPCALRKAR